MDPLELRHRLLGALAFPVTPFAEDFRLDEKGLAANVERMARAPIAAFVIAGGTGEFHSLSSDEIVRACEVAIEVLAGRVPVIVGVGGNVETGSDLARRCGRAGADGILMMPPAYGRAEDDGLFAYYAAIARATPLGSFPYARDQAVLSPSLVARLAQVPTIIAFKDGQGDLRLWRAIRDVVGDGLAWLAGVGDDLVPQYFSAGAEGFTSSIANLYPQVAVRLFELATTDIVAAEAYVARYIQPIYALRARRRGYEVTTIKAAMRLLGLPAGLVRPPLVELSKADEAALEVALDALSAAERHSIAVSSGRPSPVGSQVR